MKYAFLLFIALSFGCKKNDQVNKIADSYTGTLAITYSTGAINDTTYQAVDVIITQVSADSLLIEQTQPSSIQFGVHIHDGEITIPATAISPIVGSPVRTGSGTIRADALNYAAVYTSDAGFVTHTFTGSAQ